MVARSSQRPKTASKPQPRGEETRLKIMTAARLAILANGYAGTSVDAVCLAAGVKKGAFFHHFASKDELAAATITHFYARNARLLDMLTADAAPSREALTPEAALARLERYCDAFLAQAARDGVRGCLLGAVVGEQAASNEALRVAADACVEDWLAQLTPAFEALAPGAGLSARRLAELFFCVFEGGIILAKARRRPQELPALWAGFRQLLGRPAALT